MSRRIGVLFGDGSILTIGLKKDDGKPNPESEQLAEALAVLEGANEGVPEREGRARMVEFNLPDSSMFPIL